MVEDTVVAELIPIDQIERRIVVLRGQKVLLDSELADLYLVETKVLNQAVKRNRGRFPEDFMFQLAEEEIEALQIMAGNRDAVHGGRRYLPYAFTEQGVAMLSSVLGSPRAIAANIAIMRAFVRLRRAMASNVQLAQQLSELQAQVEENAADIESVALVIQQMLEPPPEPPRKPMGFPALA